MLNFTLHKGDSLIVGDNVVINIHEVQVIRKGRFNQVRIAVAIQAPKEIAINRDVVYLKKAQTETPAKEMLRRIQNDKDAKQQRKNQSRTDSRNDSPQGDGNNDKSVPSVQNGLQRPT